MAGVTQRTVYRLRERGRPQARPPAAALLRQPPARRPAEPGHQRHRQHRPVAPADPHPAHHVAADDRRRADHDADDQPPPGCRLAAGRARVVRRHGPHRASIAEAVRRPVGVHRGRSTPTSRRCTRGTPSSRSSGGRTRRIERLRRRERSGSTTPSYRAQFISGIIQPVMNFIANLNYVAHRGHRRHAGRERRRCRSATSSRSSSTRASSPSRSSRPRASSTCCSPRSPRRSASSSCSTRPRSSPTRSAPWRSTGRAATWPSRTSRSATCRIGRSSTGSTCVVPAGDTVAIVGPTGAGKTTLVNLLMRFYELDGGRITVDGHDTRDLTRDDLRRSFGMVLQDTWLFHGTIRENIAYGRLDATEDDVVAAAEAAHVDHFVRTLPEGYDTVIDDDATNLSAGEKQLLTIARAFLADPPILILDEATSSVDTRTEVLIQRAMGRLMRGPDDVRHRPPPVDDPRRRHDPGHGARLDRRAGHPRRAPGPARRLSRPLREPVRQCARGRQLGRSGMTTRTSHR